MEDYDPFLPLNGPNEAFQGLFDVESEFMIKEAYSESEANEKKRRQALTVIEKYSRCDNFDASIPYLAMNYFDRIYSNHPEIMMVVSDTKNNFNLFVITCLTIAWSEKIPSFNTDQFLSERGLNYEVGEVHVMQFYMFSREQWHRRPLTPICFARFFIKHMKKQTETALDLKSVLQIIIRSQCKIVFTRFRPSTVAASAVLTALADKCAQPIDYFKSVMLSSCDKVFPEELSLCAAEMDKWYKMMKARETGVGRCHWYTMGIASALAGIFLVGCVHSFFHMEFAKAVQQVYCAPCAF